MKKIIILCLMVITLTIPLALNATDEATPYPDAPEYNGDINNPDLLVVYKGDGIWVVKINGQIFVFKPNK